MNRVMLEDPKSNQEKSVEKAKNVIHEMNRQLT